MMNVVLREAKIEDLPTLLEFEQGIIQFERPYDETLKPDPISYYDIEEMIDAADVAVYVAEVDNQIVSSAYAKIKTGKPYLQHNEYVYLGFMFVRPAYRGKGINGMIMDKLKEWTKSKNLTEIRLDVYADNDAAIRAYEKAGLKKHMTTMRVRI